MSEAEDKWVDAATSMIEGSGTCWGRDISTGLKEAYYKMKAERDMLEDGIARIKKALGD